MLESGRKKMKPLIGVTSDFDVGKETSRPNYFLYEPYISAIEQAGGLPLILPYIKGSEEAGLLLDRLHGLLLTGGDFDIDPSHYGEEWTVEKRAVNERRTRFEMEIARQALARDLPVLGICGGEQTINVALKGSLYQDILSQRQGANSHELGRGKSETLHKVEIVPETLLHRIVGEKTLKVNSTHHQSVKDLGDGLQINATAGDGVIEGIESVRHGFVLGVQWHPEALFENNPGCRKVFEAFVREALKEGG
jgi:putative glutamine amidotransferase